MKKIVFTGGGTYGHAMPNVYLMEKLKKDYEFYYIGSDAIEKRLVKPYVKQYFTIPTVKLVRGKVFVNLKIPFVLISAIFKAKKALKQIKPDVVFSKGGYVALPVCIAAKMLKIPVIAHESDYSFGLANKIILKTCTKMCVNFENLTSKSKKVVYTGPIFGSNFENSTTKLTDNYKINGQTLHLNPKLPTMLVVGGSLGAVKINQMIFVLSKELQLKFNVIHNLFTLSLTTATTKICMLLVIWKKAQSQPRLICVLEITPTASIWCLKPLITLTLTKQRKQKLGAK